MALARTILVDGVDVNAQKMGREIFGGYLGGNLVDIACFGRLNRRLSSQRSQGVRCGAGGASRAQRTDIESQGGYRAAERVL